MSLLKLFISIALCTVVLPACGSKKSEKKPESVVYFVHGDPRRLLKGSTVNKSTFITKENRDNFNGFHLSGVSFFREREPQMKKENFAQVEKENSTSLKDDESAALETLPYSFIEDGDELLYEAAGNPKDSFKLSFKPVNDGYELVGLKASSGPDEQAVTVEHYSLKDDGNAFSFLVSWQSAEEGRTLVSITFTSGAVTKPLIQRSSLYNYILGHFPIKWEEDITINLCGSPSTLQQSTVKNSLVAWTRDAQRKPNDSTKEVAYEVKTEFAPFSDLNQHCIYLVSNFRAENSQEFVIAGLTIPQINTSSWELIDSDVMIFMDIVGDGFTGQANETMTHELGHFFGLGHEFEEEGHDHYRSIMGYSDGTQNVTQGDFDAIRALYNQTLSLK